MTEQEKVTVPQSIAAATDYAHDAYPRTREMMRATAMAEDPDGVTTTYERVDERTERVTWTDIKGEGFTWVQSWPCPLDEAPQIGDAYRVLHDEWFMEPGGTGTRRVIHRFEIVAKASHDG